MCAEYSCANLVGQETSGCGEHHDIATRKRYRRWGTGVTIYEDSARQEQELLPGGEVRVGVTRLMYQIQKFGKSVKLCSASSEPVQYWENIIAEQAELACLV